MNTSYLVANSLLFEKLMLFLMLAPAKYKSVGTLLEERSLICRTELLQCYKTSPVLTLTFVLTLTCVLTLTFVLCI